VIDERAVLERLLDGASLTEAEAGALLGRLTDDEVAPVWKAAILAALRAKGETGDEVRGMALAMRARSRAVRFDGDAVDTCGTGGDGSSSFNVSTAVALVVASMGVPVIKHGNRSISSKCGSADLLERVGVPLSESPEVAEATLRETGFCFLFAPNFHPAMRAVAPVRRALGVRTVFNLLGPLSNPAAPAFQLVGAYSEPAASRIADALSGMPIRRAMVVHGAPCWDEATLFGPFVRFDVAPGVVTRSVVDPVATYGLSPASPDALHGEDADENAATLHRLLAGERGAVRDTVLLNAALVLELTGRAAGPREAVQDAAAALDDGRAARLLLRLQGRA
jgi:anthranilate phosphoribosyltransferase